MGIRARRSRGTGVAATIAGVVLCSLAAARSAPVTITETGSTLIFPLFQAWVTAYGKIQPNVQVKIGATGSGTGIAQAIAKHVQIGTSDAYMTDPQTMANPHILNIPLVISAQTVETNLPGFNRAQLRLSGPVLAGIYSGTIHDWDAAEIATLNPGTSLPHHAIVPVRRSDGSGDTFIFTQFLTFSAPTWESRTGYGTTVSWPSVASGMTAKGNDGMLQTIERTPYSVGYLGASFENSARSAGLQTAMLKNQAGKFLVPNVDTITAAAASLTPRTPADERLTLVFAPGENSYPLINYEYAIVADRQENSQVASAISNFLLWCISAQGGSSAAFLDPVHFIALPTAIRARSEIQIAKIQ